MDKFETILKAGNPKLVQPCQPVTDFSKRLHDWVRAMFNIMELHQGVGIAAPQVGLAYQLFVYGFQQNQRYPNEKPISKTICVNPIVLDYEETMLESYEGCLSLPGLRGLVPRWEKVHLKAQDVSGTHFERQAEGFEARIIQHEMDHLQGILYPQKMKDLSTLGFTQEMLNAGIL